MIFSKALSESKNFIVLILPLSQRKSIKIKPEEASNRRKRLTLRTQKLNHHPIKITPSLKAKWINHNPNQLKEENLTQITHQQITLTHNPNWIQK